MATRTSSTLSAPASPLLMEDLACRPRFATRRCPERPTLGGRVAEIAALQGEPFMPWQRYAADVIMELDPDTGLLVYGEYGITVPRQSGKTTWIKAKATHRAIGMARAEYGGPQNIRYTAQTRNDARVKMVDEVWPSVLESPLGSLFRLRLTNGSEQLTCENKSRWGINANTKKSGHGGTVDEAFLDEAFAQIDWRLEQAFRPAMMTRPMAQLGVVSTAGDAESIYLWSKVKAGRARCLAGVTSGAAYLEWSADNKDPGYDPGSVDVWLSCMPAIGHTVKVERIAQDFAGMDVVEFERAYLNVWQEGTDETAIAGELWEKCLDPVSRAVNPVAFAIDVTPDRSAASIAAAARDTTGGWVHLEVIDHREGDGWVVDRVVELRERHRPSVIALDATGPAGGLLSELIEKRVPVKVLSTRDHAQACGGLESDIINRKVRHVGQGVLEAAVAGATKRSLGDAWLFDRRNTSVVLSPLVAVTIARWAHLQAPTPIDFRYGIQGTPMTSEETTDGEHG